MAEFAKMNENPRTIVDMGTRDEIVEVRLKMSMAAKMNTTSATPRSTPSSLEMADDMSASEAVRDFRSL